jgi:hypothetical protein
MATLFDSRVELKVFSFQRVQPERLSFPKYLLSPTSPTHTLFECVWHVVYESELPAVSGSDTGPAYQVLRDMNIQISHLYVPHPAGPSECELLYLLCDRCSTAWDPSLRGETESGKALEEWWHDSSVFHRRQTRMKVCWLCRLRCWGTTTAEWEKAEAGDKERERREKQTDKSGWQLQPQPCCSV